jgi:two-component system, OmpR family, KDP operon response regulator KdpE
MSSVRILIIDDEAAIRNMLRLNLKLAEYIIEEAVDGKMGIEKASEFHPNLIILDLGLPDMNGLQVLKEVRKWTRVPTIVLTVTDNEQTKVRLLDAGADDYLTKPFGPKELLARVRVALRNKGLIEATPIFSSGELEIDLSNKRVSIDGKEVKLTTTEYEVLSKLVRDHGKVVSQLQILKEIWGSTAEDETHYVRIYINQLRKKIEVNPSEPKHILTEPGVGYRLV